MLRRSWRHGRKSLRGRIDGRPDILFARALTPPLLVLLAVLAACGPSSTTTPGPSAEASRPTASAFSQTASGTVGDTSLAPLAADRVRVEVNRTTQYYTVYGKSAEEIFAYMENYGPVDDKGARASGVTHYKSRLDWRTNGDSSACAIGSMTVNVDLEVVLPSLDSLSQLPADVQASWKRFADGVAAHEQHHVDIYVQGANTVQTRMLALEPGPGCTALAANVNNIWTVEQKNTDDAQEKFHQDERARIDALRAPIKAQIDSNRDRLTALTAQIDGLDTRLATLSTQLGPLKTLLDSLQEQMRAIENRYQGQPVPIETYQQYETIRSQYNNLIPSYNTLIDEYNGQVSQRAALAPQAETLRNQTNGLVDQYNWTR